jgi:hypothetical protein
MVGDTTESSQSLLPTIRSRGKGNVSNGNQEIKGEGNQLEMNHGSQFTELRVENQVSNHVDRIPDLPEMVIDGMIPLFQLYIDVSHFSLFIS